MKRTLAGLGAALLLTACSGSREAPPAAPRPSARHLVLITIDTLRADHVGAYGYTAARTPALDSVAREGARFERAFAAAPITLTSHASLLTGLYPPGHGARHNGMRVAKGTPTLAAWLSQQGFATAGFVAAFPLDRRFGLDAGFDLYSDHLPRLPNGRPAVERPGREVVDEAVAWWQRDDGRRRFLWVHLFEPHAPYGDPRDAGRNPPVVRYDAEIGEADRQAGRLLAAIGPRRSDTLVVVAGDHGEAFGEHGEVAHSHFVYDTTLRVPLLLQGPGVGAGVVVPDPVSLVDVAPTVTRLLGVPALQGDGVDLSPALAGRPLAARDLYAESFAPLLDFGWSPLRSLRSGRWKAIEAPRPELYDVVADAAEGQDLSSSPGGKQPLADLLRRLARLGQARLDAASTADADTRSRLAALGYVQGAPAPGATRADPKDRRTLAARIALAVSGEVQGDELLALLQQILREDPGNGQALQRLGYALLDRGQYGEAERRFRAAIAAGIPSADAHLGLAICLEHRAASGEALAALRRADQVEPGNPVVLANIGIAEAAAQEQEAAARHLSAALAIDPDLHEARFNLALVHARAGRRDDARREAEDLLHRLPSAAPQRAAVERLLRALR